MNEKLGITSNIFLEEEGKRLKLPLKVVSKDELTRMKPLNGGYIINLEDSNKKGSHWTALYIYNKYAIYQDSFGSLPPVEIIRFVRKRNIKIAYNIDVIQHLESNACGYFALLFLYYMHNHRKRDLRKVLIKFTNLFSKKDTQYNDELLKRYYTSLA